MSLIAPPGSGEFPQIALAKWGQAEPQLLGSEVDSNPGRPMLGGERDGRAAAGRESAQARASVLFWALSHLTPFRLSLPRAAAIPGVAPLAHASALGVIGTSGRPGGIAPAVPSCCPIVPSEAFGSAWSSGKAYQLPRSRVPGILCISLRWLHRRGPGSIVPFRGEGRIGDPRTPWEPPPSKARSPRFDPPDGASSPGPPLWSP